MEKRLLLQNREREETLTVIAGELKSAQNFDDDLVIVCGDGQSIKTKRYLGASFVII